MDEDFRFDKNPDHGDIENEINHDDINESIEQSEQGVILLKPILIFFYSHTENVKLQLFWFLVVG